MKEVSLLFTFLVTMTVLLSSCKRMSLYDLEKAVVLELDLKLDLDVDIDLDVDVDVDIERTIKMPEHMKVLFYSPDDGGLRYTEFVSGTGGSISTPPSTYRLVAYNFGTEYTQIRNEGNINTLEAFTSDITATKGAVLRSFTRNDAEEPQGPVIYPPDHLLVAAETVTIPEWGTEDQHITIHADAKTIIETYTFEVDNITGLEYVKSAEAFVTNQAIGSFFGRGELNANPASLYFPVGVDHKHNRLYTAFNTFGKLPGESRVYLHILVIDSEGGEHRFSEDITDQFDDSEHHISFDEPVVIPPPKSGAGGGFDPTVDPWDEDNIDVPIG